MKLQLKFLCVILFPFCLGEYELTKHFYGNSVYQTIDLGSMSTKSLYFCYIQINACVIILDTKFWILNHNDWSSYLPIQWFHPCWGNQQWQLLQGLMYKFT